jgi:uncharacterized membrane protein
MSAIALPPALRYRRWSVVALVVSLAVNAFFVGAAATDFIRFRTESDSAGPHSLRVELRWLEAKLPRPGVERIEAAIGAVRPSAEARIGKLRELRRGLGDLVAQPKPDRAAIDARLSEIRAELQAMQTEIQGSVIDALLTLPPEMRANLAEASGAAKH